MNKLAWKNASQENPGHSVYYTNPARNPDMLYVIRRKRKTSDFTPTGWRVFVRSNPSQALRTIYMADTLKEAKAFVADLEQAATEETNE